MMLLTLKTFYTGKLCLKYPHHHAFGSRSCHLQTAHNGYATTSIDSLCNITNTFDTVKVHYFGRMSCLGNGACWLALNTPIKSAVPFGNKWKYCYLFILISIG